MVLIYETKDNRSNGNKSSSGWAISFGVSFGIFYLILIIIALYLVWKCNGGFDLASVLVAVFFPWIYIIYYIFARNKKCALRQAQAAVEKLAEAKDKME